MRRLASLLGIVVLLSLGGCDSDPGTGGDGGMDAGASVDAGRRDAGHEDTGLRPSGRFAEIWTDLGEGASARCGASSRS